MELKQLLKPTKSFAAYGFRQHAGGVIYTAPDAPTISVASNKFKVTTAAIGDVHIYYRMAPATSGVFGEWTEYSAPVAVTSSAAEVSVEYDILEAYVVANALTGTTASESHFVRPVLTSFTADDTERMFTAVTNEGTDATSLVLEYKDGDNWVSFYTENNPSGAVDIPYDDTWSVPTGEITVRCYTAYSSKKSVAIEATATVKSSE